MSLGLVLTPKRILDRCQERVEGRQWFFVRSANTSSNGESKKDVTPAVPGLTTVDGDVGLGWSKPAEESV